MIHIPWKDRYNINYKNIDAQHRSLVAILNELADLEEHEIEADKVAGIFHRLCQYALNHFSTEERYMAAAGYVHLERHQAEHAEFIHDLLSLNQRYEPQDFRLVEAAFEFVKTWYLRHIIVSDMDYVATVKAYHGHATIQGVIFDLSGVLCAVEEDRFLEALSALCSRPVGELRDRVEGQPSLFQGYAAGCLDTTEFLARLQELCGSIVDEERLTDAYAKVFRPVPGVLELLPRLKTSYKLGLIADTTPLRFERELASCAWLAGFDALTLPWEMKTAKPDPALFDDNLRRLNLMAEECAYVDDQPRFALAATGHLLHGVTAADTGQLLANLRRLRIDL